jgi:signal transduction histidine kinase
MSRSPEQERKASGSASPANDAADETALHAAAKRGAQTEALLRDALDSISEGFVIYDREGRLVLCNQHFLTAYGEGNGTMATADRSEVIMKRGLEGDAPINGTGLEEAWFPERLMTFRERSGTYERQLSNGRWMLATDRPMRNGGTASLRIDITSLKDTQAALRESELRLERAQTIAGMGSWEVDICSHTVMWSKGMYRIHSVPPGAIDLTQHNDAVTIHPNDLPAAERWLASLLAGVEPAPHEFRITAPGGEERILRIEGRAMPDDDGITRRILGTLQDVTERRLIERQLAHSQKMDAMGSLTGGLAHDFNNMLAVVNVNVELLKQRFGNQPEALELSNEALGAARRGADLVKRLLAFARRQPLHPVETDINALVEDIGRLLVRTLGRRVDMSLDLDPQLSPVMVDPAQLDAALANLATNARDAMPDGGRLHIATRNVHFGEGHAALYPETKPGRYVLIEVSDTGTGIAPEIIGRIYEPFFTTKGPDIGTGLGLSMVFGFAKKSGGHLSVYSEVGHGTTFRLYLPYDVLTDDDRPGQTRLPEATGGSETVLVVEDNSQLRKAVALQLLSLGYSVREADNADTALAILNDGEHVDLLFTDVIMPGKMDGYDLASRAAELRPGLRVLISSGFPGLRHHFPPDAVRLPPLLPKPYDRVELARALRGVLDDDRDPGSPGLSARGKPMLAANSRHLRGDN